LAFLNICRNEERYIEINLDCLNAVHDAIQSDVNIKGYYVWSMFDNLEWIMGYSRRFGITYVDFKTQERYPKHSYYWFQSFLNEQKI
jgi:beta-glucosidase/6-phospho-beta-glucosidase/beta-galactosidase